MKKARIMLATIAVLGLIGGTLAFKAQRSYSSAIPNYYGTTSGTGSAFSCFRTAGYTTSAPGNVTETGFLFSTKLTTATNVGPLYGVIGQTTFYCSSPTTSIYFNSGE